MNKYDIVWKEDGWTMMQDADRETHTLEISCYAENGTVTQIIKRHNDGEEEKLTGAVAENVVLPMPLKDLKKLFMKGKIVW